MAHQRGPTVPTGAPERTSVAASSSRAEPDPRLTTAAERLLGLTHADGVAIALETDGVIVCRASVGAAPDVGTELSGGTGLSARCIRTGAVVCCADSDHDARADAAACHGLDIRSAVIAPILCSNAVIGLVACFWRLPRAFEADTVAAVSYLADSIAPPLQTGLTARPDVDDGTGPRPRISGRAAMLSGTVILAGALAAFYGWPSSQPSPGSGAFHATAPAIAVGSLPGGNAAIPPVTPGRGLDLLSSAMQPVLVTRIAPEYPAGALARTTEREIVLDVSVDREGRVDQVKIVRGDPVLAIAAAGAVSRWRYRATPQSAPTFHLATRVVLQVP